MNFAYSARDPMGRRVDGELESYDIKQANLELIGRALTPRWIKPLPAKPGAGESKSFRGAPSDWTSHAFRPTGAHPVTGQDSVASTSDDARMTEPQEISREWENGVNPENPDAGHENEGADDTEIVQKKRGSKVWAFLLLLYAIAQFVKHC